MNISCRGERLSDPLLPFDYSDKFAGKFKIHEA